MAKRRVSNDMYTDHVNSDWNAVTNKERFGMIWIVMYTDIDSDPTDRNEIFDTMPKAVAYYEKLCLRPLVREVTLYAAHKAMYHTKEETHAKLTTG